MAIPSISFQFNPNGVAISQPTVGQTALIMGMAVQGPCAGEVGVSSPVQPMATESVVTSTYAAGPMPELVNGLLQAGASQVLACRIFSGTMNSSMTAAGGNTSTATIAITTKTPMGPYGAAVSAGVTGGPIVKISTASGSSTPGQFTVSLDGGNTFSAPTIATTAIYAIPGTGISIQFSAVTGSGVMVLGDSFNANITATTGSIGSVQQQNLISGSAQGAGTVTVTATTAAGPADQYEIVVAIQSTGSANIAGQTQSTFTYSLDGGNTFSSALTIPSSGTYTIGEAGEITLTFMNTGGTGGSGSAATILVPSTTGGDGVTVTALSKGIGGDQITVTVAMTGGAGTTATATLTGTAIAVVGKTSATNTAIAGAINTAAGSLVLATVFAGSTDVGNTFAVTPLAGGTGQPFQANDQYLCPVTGPYYTTADYDNVMNVVLASSTQFGFVHLTGRPATSAAAATVFGFVDAEMATAESKNRFIRTIMETPPNINGSGDAADIAAFSGINSTSYRVMVGAGDVNFTTPDGLQLQRCCSWPAAAVTALVRPGQDLAWVGAGGIANTADILRDESVLQTLNQYGFLTTRTWFGKQGYFFTSAQNMGAQGTNFQYFALGRVLDEACTAAYQALLPYVNQGLLANATTGLIDPRQAAEINNDCDVAMYNALNLAQASSGGADASGAEAQVDQSANIAETGILPVTVGVVALLYGRQIRVTAGFEVKLSSASQA